MHHLRSILLHYQHLKSLMSLRNLAKKRKEKAQEEEEEEEDGPKQKAKKIYQKAQAMLRDRFEPVKHESLRKHHLRHFHGPKT